ncbi:MAG: NAD(+) diphosphatase [Proteobacteria bacterium]|nr:NAD(+) diphosphatase [Pseudomonadota bacterium]
MSGQFIPSINPQHEQTRSAALWFIFKEHRMLVRVAGDAVSVPLLTIPAELGLSIVHHHYLGILDGRDCFSAELPDTCDAPEGTMFQGLWKLYGHLEESLYKVAVRAIQIADWDRTHQFCGRCGGQTTNREDIRAKECPNCHFIMFPRISPAVIVLVEHEDMVLLARAKRFQGDLYSVLAGFVEPGETLEETVQREIKEEVGIDVKDIRYFGSQPWPFPDSLMIAFIASYAGGRIKIDGEEIADAGWFKAGNLPEIPGNISIARRLIDWFTAKHTKI